MPSPLPTPPTAPTDGMKLEEVILEVTRKVTASFVVLSLYRCPRKGAGPVRTFTWARGRLGYQQVDEIGARLEEELLMVLMLTDGVASSLPLGDG